MTPRSTDRYRVIVGDTFELAIGAGAQLRIDSMQTDPQSTVHDADAQGMVSQDLTAEGRYYLALRTTAGSGPWCPAGVVDVVSLIDADEETLRRRISDLQALIDRPDAIRTQIAAGDGTSLSRLPLPQLKRELDKARSQLQDYLRRKQGLPSARLRR